LSACFGSQRPRADALEFELNDATRRGDVTRSSGVSAAFRESP
jgi:hypothetical protein